MDQEVKNLELELMTHVQYDPEAFTPENFLQAFRKNEVGQFENFYCFKSTIASVILLMETVMGT